MSTKASREDWHIQFHASIWKFNEDGYREVAQNLKRKPHCGTVQVAYNTDKDVFEIRCPVAHTLAVEKAMAQLIDEYIENQKRGRAKTRNISRAPESLADDISDEDDDDESEASSSDSSPSEDEGEEEEEAPTKAPQEKGVEEPQTVLQAHETTETAHTTAPPRIPEGKLIDISADEDSDPSLPYAAAKPHNSMQESNANTAANPFNDHVAPNDGLEDRTRVRRLPKPQGPARNANATSKGRGRGKTGGVGAGSTAMANLKAEFESALPVLPPVPEKKTDTRRRLGGGEGAGVKGRDGRKE